MLTIRNLTKRYGSLVALSDVSLSLQPGEFFGLLGPNRAGKTTLMSLAFRRTQRVTKALA